MKVSRSDLGMLSKTLMDSQKAITTLLTYDKRNDVTLTFAEEISLRKSKEAIKEILKYD